jgi:tetratricopeptide (TPR) repeat protein
MTEPNPRRQKWIVAALIGAVVLAVFRPALHCAFVGLDDPDYVVENANVQHGFTWTSIKWAFTTGHAANWHPLTWLSHMLDFKLYGLNPSGHHLTSLVLHTASSVFLFLLLNRMTRALWRSAWVAAIFALHPLRVESVVWIAERKDVLSTFFWMLTVLAYVRYTEEFKVQSSKFKVFYGLALVLFACALMSKAMVVTLPFVLLLLDFWPLGRVEWGSRFSWRIITEKIPFLALAVAASVTTFLVQTRAGVVAPLARIPLDDRLANAAVAYVRYLANIFWPSGLAVFYGRQVWNSYQVSGAVFLLGVITLLVLWRLRTQPYLAMGWFWFLGTLVPVLGLVAQGQQSLADRFTYVPSIGISIMLAWSIADLAVRRPALLKIVATFGALTVIACGILTPRQIVFWKSLASLYARAADVSDQDAQTCFNVGWSALQQGDFPRAAKCFERALKVADKSASSSFLAQTKNNLGCALLEQGQVPNAISNFENALILQPAFPQAYFNMGRAFLTNQQPDVAVDCFKRALTMDNNPVVLGALADAYARQGKFSEAASTAQRARQLALEQNNKKLADALELRSRQYQKGGGGSSP